MWEPAPSSPMSWNSMSFTTEPESPSNPESVKFDDHLFIGLTEFPLENDNLDLITRQFMQVIDNIHRVFEDGIKNVHKRYPDGERKFDVTKTAEMLISDIELQPETKKELNERFCLIYTGQRRLARNLLRDVVGRYVGNEPDSLYALNEIQKVAALMRFELERGKIDEFADLLNYHWELSRKVDAGSTNTLIDQIFLSIEDLIDAKMVCGAGGGGFLQVILKKGVQKADVHKRLKDVFQDNPVDVWDCEII